LGIVSFIEFVLVFLISVDILQARWALLKARRDRIVVELESVVEK